MFYTMKFAIMFVVASLMLIGATIATATPNPVHADKPVTQYCLDVDPDVCAKTKDLCKPLIGAAAGAKKCVRVVIG